jgi:hypothetical protein
MPPPPFTREEPVLAQGHGEEHSHVEDRQYQAGAPDRDQVIANISPQHHQTFPSLSLQRRKTLTLEDELSAVNARTSASTSTFFNPSESIMGPIDPDINYGRGTGASSAVSEPNSHERLDHDGHVQHEDDAEDEEEADNGAGNLIDDHDHTLLPFLHRRKTLEDELSAVGVGVGAGGTDLTDLDFDGSTLIDNEADCNEHEQWQHMKIGVVSSALACDGDGDDQQLLNDTSSEVTMPKLEPEPHWRRKKKTTTNAVQLQRHHLFFSSQTNRTT